MVSAPELLASKDMEALRFRLFTCRVDRLRELSDKLLLLCNTANFAGYHTQNALSSETCQSIRTRMEQHGYEAKPNTKRTVVASVQTALAYAEISTGDGELPGGTS
jgi:hypothetical protein